MKALLVVLISLLCFAGIETSFALQADEVLLIVNRNNPSSIQLAEYYRSKRQIPAANLPTANTTD